MEEQVLSKNQMRELKDLGIDISKASMCYCDLESDEYHFGSDVIVPNNATLSEFGLYKENLIPTFTLQDILKIIKEKILKRDLSLDLEVDILNNCFNLTKEIDYRIYTSEGKSLLNAAFNMLKWCKENKYI